MKAIMVRIRVRVRFRRKDINQGLKGQAIWLRVRFWFIWVIWVRVRFRARFGVTFRFRVNLGLRLVPNAVFNTTKCD